MKITIAKQDLENALAVTKLSVSGDADLSGHYLFRIRASKVEILSYHQRVFSLAPVVATVDGKDGDSFTVEAWRLDKWVGGVADGVLTLSSDGAGDVTCSGPRSKVKMRSLDPSKFPYWDKLAAAATSSGKVLPASLSRALSVSRWFVSGDDTSKPELCQIEAVKGVFWATDRRAFSSAEIPGLENLSIRIPSKDIGSLVKFLNEKGTVDGGEVDIRESNRAEGGGAAFFFRADGSYFGVTRPTTSLPPLNKDNRDLPDSFQITLDREEFSSAYSMISSAAPKGYDRVTFRYADDNLIVSMPSEAGGVTDFAMTLSTVKNPEAFTMMFNIDVSYIQGLMATFGGDKLTLGCTPRDLIGYCSFHHFDNEEDEAASAAIGELTEVGDTDRPDWTPTLEEFKKYKRAGLSLKGTRYYTVVGWRS